MILEKAETATEEPPPPVAVFDAEWPAALAFTRCLGRAGVSVHVYSHRWLPPARLSRGAVLFARCPRLSDIQTFHRWFTEEVRSGRIGLVAPTSDLLLYHLARLGSRQPPVMARSLAPAEVLLSVILKDRFAERCAEFGIRAPRTRTPRSLEEARAAAGELGFPIVLKPRSHVGLGGGRGRVVADEPSLREFFRRSPFEAHGDSVVQDFPDLQWPLVQEYVPHGPGDLLSVAGVLSPEGRLLGAAAGRKWAQWPSRLGVGTLFEDLDDGALVAGGCEIARRLLGRGLFELEFVRDRRSGDLLALDLNARGYGQIGLEVARGLDLPLLWYKSATGPASGLPPLAAAGGVAWVNALPYILGRLLRPRSEGGDRDVWRDHASALRKRRVHAGLDRNDPVASALFLWGTARSSFEFVRGFLRRGA